MKRTAGIAFAAALVASATFAQAEPEKGGGSDPLSAMGVPLIFAAGLAIYLDSHQLAPCPPGYHHGIDLFSGADRCFADDMSGRTAPGG